MNICFSSSAVGLLGCDSHSLIPMMDTYKFQQIITIEEVKSQVSFVVLQMYLLEHTDGEVLSQIVEPITPEEGAGSSGRRFQICLHLFTYLFPFIFQKKLQ